MTPGARQTPATSNRSKRRRVDSGNDGGQNVEEQPSSQKRQRVSQACDICRSRKDRCDGARPICSTCASLNRPCTYKPNPKKRGLPTGYLRTLEVLWGAVFCRVRGSEQTVRRLMKTTNLPGSAEDTSNEGELSETFLSAWKNSTALKEIENLLSASENTDGDAEWPNHGFYGNPSPGGSQQETTISPVSLEWHDSEETGHIQGAPVANPARMNQVAHTQLSTDPSSVRQSRDAGTQCDLEPKTSEAQRYNAYPTRTPRTMTSGGARDSEVFNLVLPQNTRQLFDIYFSYTHCWFPILEKHDILRTAFSYNESPTQLSASSPGSGDHAATWAILALTSIQQSAKQQDSGSDAHQGTHSEPDSLFSTARRLIPLENGHYEPGHVQALLILAMVRIGQRDWSSSWILTGLAIRIAISLKLDDSSITRNSATAPNSRTHGRSKHIFLGCFVLDTLVAAEMGRPPLLTRADVSRTGHLDEDGLEEWHPWEDPASLFQGSTSRDFFFRGPLHAMSTFNRLVSVMSILNDFCCRTRKESFTLSKFEELERQLQSWTSSLPEIFLLDTPGNNPTVASPHLLGLHIIYRSLVALVRLRSQAHLSGHNIPHGGPDSRFTTTIKELVRLVQTYIDNYSLCATPPTFYLLLRLATRGLYEQNADHISPVLEPELRLRLQTLLSQLSLIWESRSSASHQNMPTGSLSMSPNADVPALSQYSSRPIINNTEPRVQAPRTRGNPIYGASSYGFNERRHENDIAEDNSARPDSTSSGSWMRAMPELDASIQLPLQSPTASLPPDPISSHTPAPLSSGMDHSVGATDDLSTPSNPSNQQYPYLYSTTNIDPGNLVSVDNYGVSQWSRVPPDLDALFAEMASLEGSDKTENHPAFMRNLGFTPNSGISQLYTHSSHIDPFLLPQTQPAAPESHNSVEDNGRIAPAR